MTNGDRIRSMSDRELAKNIPLKCSQCVYDLLAKEPWDCVKLGLDCTYGRTRSGTGGEEEMKCPYCGCKTRVEETASDGVKTYRRRVCTRCYKISGTTEEFTDTKATEAALYRIKWIQKKERQARYE